MKKINLVFLAFMLFLSSIDKYGLWIAFLFFILYHRKTNRKEILILLILLLRLCIPVSNKVFDETIIQGKVSAVSSSSITLSCNNQKYQIITQEKVCLDDEIQVQIQSINNQDSSHFYSFDTAKYQKEKGIQATYYAEKVELIKKGKTLRNFLHQKILLQKEEVQDLYLKLILNQSGTELTLLQCGFHILWIIHFIDKIMRYFLDEIKAKQVKMGMIIFLLFFFHFPISLLRTFFNEFFKNKMDKKTILACYTILLYLINPALLQSVGYIIPVGLSLLEQNKVKRMLFLVIMQSYYFYECSWIKLLFFSFFNRLNGTLTIIGLFDLLLHQSFLSYFYPWILKLDTFCNFSMLNGVGKLPSYFILFCLYLLYAQNYQRIITCLLCLSFVLLQFNLVSIFGEVSFINVGQGDSILIHLPLAQGTFLIDTGKASSYRHLKSFLKAKGIKQIDALVITHDDSDHSGAKEYIIEDFKVKKVVENYSDSIILHDFHLFFLSPKQDYGNKNDNSLVCAFAFNGLDFLLLGDISAKVEKELCNQYEERSFDFVKIAHHGSKTSTSISLLKHFDFNYAIISSGVNNRYSHPNSEVLKRLNSFGISYLDTQVHGDITITMTTFFNFILTSNQEFVIMEKVVTK